jgi:DNA-binding NarL/FixJ family response regulator
MPSVLLAEDSKIIAERLQQLITEAGNNIILQHASNYEEAIKFIEEVKPSIALVDIKLPGKSGIDLLRFIHRKKMTIAIVMVTNTTNLAYKNICTQLGASYFLDKSLEFELLPGIIKNLTNVANA